MRSRIGMVAMRRRVPPVDRTCHNTETGLSLGPGLLGKSEDSTHSARQTDGTEYHVQDGDAVRAPDWGSVPLADLGIDVVPTILDALGIAPSRHRIEGRSLLPLVRGEAAAGWRDCVYSELDYGYRRARKVLRRGVRECKGVMVRTQAWKYVHWEGFRPQLFDLEADPRELTDLGSDPRCGAPRAQLRERLFDWLASGKARTTVGDDDVASHTDNHRERGIHIGIW